MRVVVRTDASTVIGSGHVMRCLALAQSLRDVAAQIVFVCRMLPGNLCDFIESHGYEVLRLSYPADSLESERWGIDAEQTISALESRKLTTDWVIVDHYALDRRWEFALRPLAAKIMAVDDLANRHHDCDLLLDQNLYTDMVTRYDALTPISCTKLLGPMYALLRPEFRNTRANIRERDGTVRRMLFFFGGSDPSNETAKALDALRLLGRSDIAVDVVVGASNPNSHQIEKQCGALSSVSFHCQVKNMAELMAAADLALGAGGTTTWERCCLGLPTLAIVVADNQVESVRTLAQAEIVFSLGAGSQVCSSDIAKALQQFLDDRDRCVMMSGASMQLVDGNGAERVSQALLLGVNHGR